jgi:hypothetical protein
MLQQQMFAMSEQLVLLEHLILSQQESLNFSQYLSPQSAVPASQPPSIYSESSSTSTTTSSRSSSSYSSNLPPAGIKPDPLRTPRVSSAPEYTSTTSYSSPSSTTTTSSSYSSSPSVAKLEESAPVEAEVEPENEADLDDAERIRRRRLMRFSGNNLSGSR